MEVNLADLPAWDVEEVDVVLLPAADVATTKDIVVSVVIKNKVFETHL